MRHKREAVDMLGKQTNKAQHYAKKEAAKDNRRHAAATTTTTLTGSTYVPAYQDNYGDSNGTATEGQHSAAFRAWRRHRNNHKSDASFSSFLLCCCLSSPSSFSSFLFFFCVVCSPRNNNCKLKRTTGIQITLSRRNQLRQKESAQSSRGESSRVDAGQGPGCAPGPVPVSGLAIVSRHRLHRQAKGQ